MKHTWSRDLFKVKTNTMRKIILLIIPIVFFGLAFICNIAFADLLGIVNQRSVGEPAALVSFNPNKGVVKKYHGSYLPYSSTPVLTYDSSNNKLYLFAQESRNLYSIDPIDLGIKMIGFMNFPASVPTLPYDWAGDEMGGLCYNPSNNTLYFTADRWDIDIVTLKWKNLRTELYVVNTDDASLTSLGIISGSFIETIGYNDVDQKLYGIARHDPGPYINNSHLVTIDPEVAVITEVLELPYPILDGLAQKPGTNIFYSWSNDPSNNYIKIDLDQNTFTVLSDADSVRVMGGMVYKNFPVSTAIKVNIDIKPDLIDLDSNDLIEVTIFSTIGFNAPKTIDVNSLTFGRTGSEHSLAFCNKNAQNLVCYFNPQETDFLCGAVGYSVGILKGKTVRGKPIEGIDSVNTNPCEDPEYFFNLEAQEKTQRRTISHSIAWE